MKQTWQGTLKILETALCLCVFQGAERKWWSANTPFLAVCYPEYNHVHICAFVNKPSIF